ncbi:probable 1,4-dihydroxy-2-naphthoate octaprenyltransferase [Arthrobacter sp. Hiyo1]|nr:probable 1,4-dihydroxy-2-naphthoate octaprenyltransferase [Arthrobacter sp. Hiyo1]
MATAAQWIQGARLRTLPAAIAPVLIGTAAAYELQSFRLLNAILAALVALLLQIGVNYANDYSDGIRAPTRTAWVRSGWSVPALHDRTTSSGLRSARSAWP